MFEDLKNRYDKTLSEAKNLDSKRDYLQDKVHELKNSSKQDHADNLGIASDFFNSIPIIGGLVGAPLGSARDALEKERHRLEDQLSEVEDLRSRTLAEANSQFDNLNSAQEMSLAYVNPARIGATGQRRTVEKLEKPKSF